jgi:hypothetical protein
MLDRIEGELVPLGEVTLLNSAYEADATEQQTVPSSDHTCTTPSTFTAPSENPLPDVDGKYSKFLARVCPGKISFDGDAT